MAVRRVLERLLRLRELEEEQSRLELEAAVGDRNRVARDLSEAVRRHAQGRLGFAAGIGESDTAARVGAVVEIEHSRRLCQHIEPRLEAADIEMTRQREKFLVRRTERQQVETLVDREQATAREVVGRRAQQMLDDWYGRRSQRGSVRPVSGAVFGFSSAEKTPDDSSAPKTPEPECNLEKEACIPPMKSA